MKNCPQCGQSRVGETLKCPDCDVFYSQLDEILYAEQQRIEQNTLQGRLRRIWEADDRWEALREYRREIWVTTPWQTKITLWTVFAFLFVLVFGVLTL